MSQSGISREDLFISKYSCTSAATTITYWRTRCVAATKCISSSHGYQKTLKGVETSLKKIPGGARSAGRGGKFKLITFATCQDISIYF